LSNTGVKYIGTKQTEQLQIVIKEAKMAGSQPYKCDFHIHTPISKCYKDKSVTPDGIIQAALGKGLDAIAITDHNSIEGISGVIAASAGTGIIVFPGFELTAAGGHIIAIFDPGTKLFTLAEVV